MLTPKEVRAPGRNKVLPHAADTVVPRFSLKVLAVGASGNHWSGVTTSQLSNLSGVRNQVLRQGSSAAAPQGGSVLRQPSVWRDLCNCSAASLLRWRRSFSRGGLSNIALPRSRNPSDLSPRRSRPCGTATPSSRSRRSTTRPD